MSFTSIEIFALIIAVVIAVKIISILISPRAWMRLGKGIFAIPILTMIISLILAGVVLYYLLQTLNIVQIFGVMLFVILLAATTLSTYVKEVMPAFEKLLKTKKLLRKAWLSIIIWIALVIWVLVVLFS